MTNFIFYRQSFDEVSGDWQGNVTLTECQLFKDLIGNGVSESGAVDVIARLKSDRIYTLYEPNSNQQFLYGLWRRETQTVKPPPPEPKKEEEVTPTQLMEFYCLIKDVSWLFVKEPPGNEAKIILGSQYDTYCNAVNFLMGLENELRDKVRV